MYFLKLNVQLAVKEFRLFENLTLTIKIIFVKQSIISLGRPLFDSLYAFIVQFLGHRLAILVKSSKGLERKVKYIHDIDNFATIHWTNFIHGR